eukprot:SAG11_NODE_305_length_10996_cov_4.698082_8_plen_163_part_00
MNEISDEHVPAYIKDDLLREAEEKKESEAKKAADLKTKREALAAQKNQICFVVCRGEDMHFARPDKDTVGLLVPIFSVRGSRRAFDCLTSELRSAPLIFAILPLAFSAQFWGDAKLEIYEALGIGAQPDCLRLCFCRVGSRVNVILLARSLAILTPQLTARV